MICILKSPPPTTRSALTRAPVSGHKPGPSQCEGNPEPHRSAARIIVRSSRNGASKLPILQRFLPKVNQSEGITAALSVQVSQTTPAPRSGACRGKTRRKRRGRNRGDGIRDRAGEGGPCYPVVTPASEQLLCFHLDSRLVKISTCVFIDIPASPRVFHSAPLFS